MTKKEYNAVISIRAPKKALKERLVRNIKATLGQGKFAAADVEHLEILENPDKPYKIFLKDNTPKPVKEKVAKVKKETPVVAEGEAEGEDAPKPEPLTAPIEETKEIKIDGQ